ncbi:MAG: toprim domain-containing protein [Rhodospirillaceae bacterium]|nr:toprim domain-containing protein [Rhodospirillaceae bacterium]
MRKLGAPKGVDPAPFARWAGDPAQASAPVEMSPEREFAQALKDHGLALEGPPIMDGKWHEVPVQGDRKKMSGSYRAFLDGRPAGTITNYKADGPVKWVATGAALDEATRAQIQAEAAQVRAAREAERAKVAEAAAKKAYGVWENLHRAATPENCPYLAEKGVKGHGVKVDKDGHLVVPARDADGKLWTIQIVHEDGKRYIKESQKAGSFHVIEPSGRGSLAATGNGPIVIAEGYATAATIHEATGMPAVVAFDSGNLKPVAEAIRAANPEREIIIVADNDHANIHGNVGMKKGEEAAQAVGGVMVAPKLTVEEKEKGLTDFNDLAQKRGNAALRNSFRMALEQSRGPQRGVA